jgi:hypothetical protein
MFDIGLNSAKPSATNSKRFSAPASIPVRKLKRGQILTEADVGTSDEKIAISVGGWAA